MISLVDLAIVFSGAVLLSAAALEEALVNTIPYVVTVTLLLSNVPHLLAASFAEVSSEIWKNI